ncbi:hypothetical protein EDB19DRAFT_2029243 [Suillus lakei]|nr:hypothetical protein EDB19DRAFT_2029243 [Suillus lakei]
MWYKQPSVAWVIIATTIFGFLFYSLTVMACLISPSCPFQTPISTVLRMLHIDRLLHLIFKPTFRYLQQLASSAHGVLQRRLGTFRSSWTRVSEALEGPVRATGAFARRSHKLLFAALHKGLRSLAPYSSTKVVDWEAQSFDQKLDVLAESKCILTLDLPDISISDLEAPSIKWLLETSTDPEVFLAAANPVPQVEWPLDLDVSDMLHQLSDSFTSCVDIQEQIVPVVGGEGLGMRTDYHMFLQMSVRGMHTADGVVLATTRNICVPEDVYMRFPFCDIKLLSSPSSPSTQIVANCTLLACVMVGVYVDKKDIVRIDKSSALPQLMGSLLPQFQKVLWAWDGGDLDNDSTGVTRRAWKLLKVICPIFELPSFDTMRNLDVCRKIYSRVRSSEQDYTWDLLKALRNTLHFMFTAANVSRDPTRVWNGRFWCRDDSHSPEDFDWLVDYLDYIDPDDHEAAYDILLLLGSMGVSCSPAKQHLFVERLLAYMDSTMPDSLRNAALRAAHSAREEIASIDAIDDARLRDMILTKLSPAILSVLCPRPSPTPVNDSFIYYYHRNLCYLELVCTLARNFNWHPHLYGDHHIDRCISMSAEYCKLRSEHTVHVAGILLRIASRQTSVTLLDSVTEQQWWDVMRSAWNGHLNIFSTHCLEFLPVLAGGTKKYMRIASQSDLEQLIGNVDRVLERLDMRRDMRREDMQWQEMLLEMRPEMQALKEGEGNAITVKELRTAASNMLESLEPSNQKKGWGNVCMCGSGKYQDLNEIDIKSSVISDLVDARRREEPLA